MKSSGACLVARSLLNQGVDTLFCYPGAAVLPLLDSLCALEKINCVLTAGEQGAVFAADGYARSSGRPGVVIATSGPGATNLVTGIADAFMDSVPLVVITGNVSTDKLGRDSFQEVDTFGITMPVTKYGYIVKNAEDIPAVISEAFAIASSGRKGPVLVDIPENVFAQTAEYRCPEISVRPLKKDLSSLEKVAALINGSRYPLIYAGGGAKASACKPLIEKFASRINAPVATSMMGIGAFDCSHPLSIGTAVAHNPLPARALQSADLLVCLGARFASKAENGFLTYNKKMKLVHIDIDMAEIDKNHTADGYLACDLKEALELLLPRLNPKTESLVSLLGSPSLPPSLPFGLLAAADSVLPPSKTVVTDVGLHQLWAAASFKFDGNDKFISSCGLGSMGFGTGAAIGALFADGNSPTVLVTGDGSFNMDMNELATAVRYKLPLIVMLFDNNSLGMIRKFQKKSYRGRYFCSTLNLRTDYAALAEAMGARAVRANSEESMVSAVKDALKYKDKPTLIHIKTPINILD